jgi:hypothetical protein
VKHEKSILENAVRMQGICCVELQIGRNKRKARIKTAKRTL